MSTNTPNPSPARGPTTDSLDALNIVIEGNGDTTIRPVNPKHLPHIREIKRLHRKLVAFQDAAGNQQRVFAVAVREHVGQRSRRHRMARGRRRGEERHVVGGAGRQVDGVVADSMPPDHHQSLGPAGESIGGTTKFLIGTAFHPERAYDMEKEFERLQEKADLGAHFAMSQVLFDFERRLRKQKNFSSKASIQRFSGIASCLLRKRQAIRKCRTTILILARGLHTGRIREATRHTRGWSISSPGNTWIECLHNFETTSLPSMAIAACWIQRFANNSRV